MEELTLNRHKQLLRDQLPMILKNPLYHDYHLFLLNNLRERDVINDQEYLYYMGEYNIEEN